MNLPVGTITLLIIAVLVYFGVAQRLLDRMRLTDRTALLFIGGMLVGTFIPDIPLGSRLAINVGGGLIPTVFALYLWFTADESQERWRTLWATIVASALVYAASIWLPIEPAYVIIDPIYAFALIAGLTAYLFGRSRRAAFIAGILAITLNDVFYALQVSYHRQAGYTVIGGAGIFDTIVFSSLLAVALAELVGETREKIAGGHQEDDNGSSRLVRLPTDRSQGKEGKDE